MDRVAGLLPTATIKRNISVLLRYNMPVPPADTHHEATTGEVSVMRPAVVEDDQNGQTLRHDCVYCFSRTPYYILAPSIVVWLALRTLTGCSAGILLLVTQRCCLMLYICEKN